LKASKYQSGTHLSRLEIYPAEGRCPICSYAGRRNKRIMIQNDPEILLLFCPQCSGLSASHMPTHEALARYYGSYYQHRERERITFYKPIRLARHIASMVALNSAHDLHIMDFGGGDGSISVLTAGLISREMQQPAHVQVVDLVEGEPAQSSSVNIEFVHDLRNARGNCDLIIASAVFEHIPDLASVIPQVIGKLRLGGFLYVRTPYMLPFMKIIGLDMTYPGHVHDLGDRFWGNLPKWSSIPVKIVRARPAIVESGFRQNFIVTIAAHCLKFPSRVECLWTRHPIFKLYGGWEVLIRRTG
jgi:methyltransferase family protein